MIEYKADKSKEECIKLIEARTKNYKIQKLILNMDSEDEAHIQSSVKDYDFILYSNSKKMIYFSAPKAFYGTVSGDNKQSVIRGKFRLTKNCFWGLLSNILSVFIVTVGSSVIKFNLNDFISCIVISLIFSLVMIIAMEIFSFMFRKSAYKQIKDFLIELSTDDESFHN